MHDSPRAFFRIPRLGWSLALVVVFSPLLLQSLAELRREPVERGVAELLIFPAVFILVLAAYSFWMFRLEVAPDGMILYRVHQAGWNEIVSARKRRFLFLPYLYLTRRTGRAWWVPLYFVGREPVGAALLRHAPEGHPVRQALQP